jgi:hypothetical protein
MAQVVSITISDAIQIAMTTTRFPTGNFTVTNESLSPTHLRLIKLQIHPSIERQHSDKLVCCGFSGMNAKV